MNKYFSLPGYEKFFYLIKILIQYRAAHEDKFITDHIIDSAYDLPSELIWGGGRCFNNKTDYKLVADAIAWYDSINLSLKHICTNSLINEDNIHDKKCNEFFKKYVHLNKDSVTLYSKLLRDYLYQTYGKMPITWSTTLGITDIDTINQMTENDIYVLNYNYNNNNEYLAQLKYKHNIEILCAEPCGENCPNRELHYYYKSKLLMGIPLAKDESLACPYIDMHDLPGVQESFNIIQSRKHAITLNRIDELANMGFNKFKISGRAYSDELWLKVICYYLVKPEYTEQVYNEIYHSYIKQKLKNQLFNKAS